MQPFTTPWSPSTFERRLTRTWWQVGAVVIAVGSAVITVACSLVVGGLIVRRHARSIGSAMTAVGVAPGIAPIVFFWYPPAVAIGVVGLAVFVFALHDAGEARRPAGAQVIP